MFRDKKNRGVLALASGFILMAGTAGTYAQNDMKARIARAYGQSDWCIGRVCRIVPPQPPVHDGFGSAITFSEDQGELLLAVGAPDDGSGSVQFFRQSGDRWVGTGAMRSPAGRSARSFGESISISGRLMLVGDDDMSLRDVDNVGETYVYRRFGTGWVADDIEGWGWRWSGCDEENSHFGHSVSIQDHGDGTAKAVVGEPGLRHHTGAAYVFNRWIDVPNDVSFWTPSLYQFAPPGLAGRAEFGSAVACNTGFLAVGAPHDNDEAGVPSGSVYVYIFNSTVFSKLTAWDGLQRDSLFGNAVAMTDDLIVVGAPGDDSEAGSAYIFRRNGNAWEPEEKLTGSGLAGARLGESVAVSGDIIAVGAPGADEAAGQVYIFQYDGSSWCPKPTLTAFDPAIGDKLGTAVAVAGNVVVVGAPLSLGTESGFVYAYDGVPFAYGDSNLNGVFSMADLNQLIDWVLEREPMPAPGTLRFTLSDVNGDGTLDEADINLYVDRLLLRIDCFPVEEPCNP